MNPNIGINGEACARKKWKRQDVHLNKTEKDDKRNKKKWRENSSSVDGKEKGNGTLSRKRPSMSRQLSRRISQEFARRRSSIKEELPDSPQGWAILLGVVSSILIGYEINLQSELTCPPLVYCQDHTKMIVEKMSILSRTIKPSLFVGTRGVMSSIAGYLKLGPQQERRFRQVQTMAWDGAHVAVDWEIPEGVIKTDVLQGPITKPVVLMVHGMNNDSSFGYVRSLMQTCTKRGWIAACMNLRGCGGVPLSTPRGYNGAYTGDLRCIVQTIAARLAPEASIFVVGHSLGANIVTKYLGEESAAGTLPEEVAGGVGLGNPLALDTSHLSFPWGHVLSLGVRRTVLSNLGRLRQMHDRHYRRGYRNVLLSNHIRDLDEARCTFDIRNEPYYPFAPRLGYDKVQDYYTDASSYFYARHVSVPLLHILSQDDFLCYGPSLQKLNYLLQNPNVVVVKTKCGGHLGWHEAPPDTENMFGFGTSWADTATAEFIEAVLASRNEKPSFADKKASGDGSFVHSRDAAREVASKLRSKL